MSYTIHSDNTLLFQANFFSFFVFFLQGVLQRLKFAKKPKVNQNPQFFFYILSIGRDYNPGFCVSVFWDILDKS